MARRLKKDTERLYLESFLNQVGWQHCRIVGEPDPPDFLLDTDDGVLAVEVTQLYRTRVSTDHRYGPTRKEDQSSSEISRASTTHKAGGRCWSRQCSLTSW